MLIRVPRRLIPAPDMETRVGSAAARTHRRSWWALLYRDGRIIHEWDADPGSPNGHADWPRLPFSGRQQLRLYCPNGQVATLGASVDNTGRLFQYKVALRSVSVGGGAVGQQVLAHLIGMVRNDADDGSCVCYAWEPQPEPLPPSNAPVRPTPPSPFCANPSEALARFRQEQVDWAAAYEVWHNNPDYVLWEHEHKAWDTTSGGRLVGPWDDNVYRMQYHNTGRLAFDVLGLKLD